MSGDALKCAEALKKFEALRKQLTDAVRFAKGMAAKSMQDPHRVLFMQLADRILADWTCAWPPRADELGVELGLFSDKERFDPTAWAGIDAQSIANKMLDCRRAYLDLLRWYDTLPPQQQSELFPLGKPKPR